MNWTNCIWFFTNCLWRNKQKSTRWFQRKASNVAALENSCSCIFLAKRTKKNHRHEATKHKKILFNRRCGPSAYETSYEKSRTRTLHAERAEQKRLHHWWVKCFNSLYECWRGVLWPFHFDNRAKKWKAKVMSVNCPNVCALRIEVITMLNADSPTATMRFLAQRDKTKKIISKIDKKSSWAEQKCVRVRCGKEQRRDRRTSNSTRNNMDVQLFLSTLIWRHIQTVIRKCKKAMCIVFSFKNDVYCWADIEQKTIDSNQLRCWWIRSIDSQTICARPQNCLLTLLPCSELFVDHQKLSTNWNLYKFHDVHIS